MEETYYEMDLPRENIHLRCFAHSIMNYRYHWHPDEYELSIVLKGNQEYCRGTETHSLFEDDLILTAPGNGHASMRQQPDTRALVLHFPSNALKLLVKKGYIYQFPTCLSNENTRYEERFCRIRFYASQIWQSLECGGTYAQLSAKVNLELLLITLFIITNLVNSRQGRAIMSSRDNRIAAESVGLNVSEYKLTAFVISAALAGVAGVLYSHNLANLQATSKNFGYNQSILILVFVVLGGIGNIRGSLIAALVLTILPEKLRFFNDYRMLIYAIVLIVMMIMTSAPKVVAWRKMVAEKYFKKSRETEAGGKSDAKEV